MNDDELAAGIPQPVESCNALEAWQADVEERQATQFRRLLLSVGAALIILGVGLTLAVASNRSLSKQIQSERLHGYVVSCSDQNDRHVDAIVKLEKQTDDEWTVAFATALIDALAPLRTNCDAFAASRVQAR